MSAEQPVIRVPAGWSYDEKSAFECGQRETTYVITHDACGTEHKEFCRPVGDGGDGWWYRRKCGEGLWFFIGIHEKTCTAAADGT